MYTLTRTYIHTDIVEVVESTSTSQKEGLELTWDSIFDYQGTVIGFNFVILITNKAH